MRALLYERLAWAHALAGNDTAAERSRHAAQRSQGRVVARRGRRTPSTVASQR
ncbi:hypothetical protein [Streptomyces sp. NPDC029554]|uniref:hypothetical protein n=1 Tax=Streptomyces sp. NPDC029554 TaxID=3155126 RepID=UPI0033C63D01